MSLREGSLREWQTQLSQALLLENPGPLSDFPALRSIPEERLALYEELLFSTILETLESIYPYTHRLLSSPDTAEEDGETAWRQRIETFRRRHPNDSYKLMGVIAAFPGFVAAQSDWMARYPFIADLCLYEWLEMEALNAPSAPAPPDLHAGVPDPADWDAYGPYWNPTRKLHGFRFQVPQILEALNALEEPWDLERLPAEALAVFAENSVDILIYRDPETLEARFFCLNTLTAALIRIASAPNLSYREVLSQLVAEVPFLRDIPEVILQAQAWSLLQLCAENGSLLGSLTGY